MLWLILALAVFSVAIFIVSDTKGWLLRAYFLKALASFGFIGVLVLVLYEKLFHVGSFFYLGDEFLDYLPFAFLFLLALVSGLIGDLVLQLRPFRPQADKDQIIFSGVVAFSAGHIFYYSALVGLGGFSFYPFIGAIILTGLVFFFSRFMKLEWGKSFWPCVWYSFIIFLMTCQAVVIGIRFGFGWFEIFVLAGASLFALSDLILSQVYFRKEPKAIMSVLNLSTYYSAQILLALSLLFLL